MYKNAVDLSGMNVAGSKSITVWVRVEDVSKLEKIRVNLFDEKSLNDAGDIASWTPPYPYARFWDIPASEFESGVWKQIQLTDATCSSNGIWTAPDYTLIKRVEFHAFALEANTQISVCFDDLRFGDCLPDEEPEGEGFNETFDTIDGWTAPQGSITVSTESPRQGAGSMLLSGAPAEALIAEKVYGEPMDLSGMAVPNGKSITLWVRIADVTKLQYLQIDMYDASCADASGNVDWGNPHLRRWNFPASDFKSGVWKQIQLTDFDTNIQNPWGCSMEYSQVRKLSFLAYVDGANTQADICFDDMQFADSSRPDSFNDNFDELNRWEATSGSLSVSGESPKEGTGSLYLSGTPQAPYTDLAVKRVYGTPMDLSAIAQQGIGSAALWVRVQDTAKMSKVVIDLADADGVNDEGNIIWDAGNIHVARWEFPVSFFESGEWIRIQLTADSPYRINPWNCEVDFSRIKLMVMGGQVTEPGVQGELYFDDLYYGDYELEGETTLDHMDSLSGWDSTAGSVAAKKDEEGRTLVELSSKGAPNTELNMNKYFAQPIDLSAVGRGEKDLVFRFKVNNRSEIQPGGNPQWQGIRIDVIGKGGYTNGVRNWTCAKAWEFANFRLENDNWATLSINAADANVYFNWPELNFSEVQGFSIILSVKAGCDIQLQLDRIYLSDPLEKEPDPVEPTVLDKMEDNYDGRWTADGDLIEDMVDHEQGDGAPGAYYQRERDGLHGSKL